MSIDKLKTVYSTGAWFPNVKTFFKKINEIIDYLNGVGNSGDGSYKVYSALLTQSGTDAPTAVILKNTLGGTLVWSYTSTGAYLGTLTGAFPDSNKMWFMPIVPSDITATGYLGYQNANSIVVSTYSDPATVTLADDLLSSTSIEFRVYN